jgi:peptidoglycan/LPS O-acetylase OafA/YrhL
MGSAVRQQFIPSLESIRGLAALCVCGVHSFHGVPFVPQFRGAPTSPYLMDFFVGAGNSAVTLFFVLSGFVLTLSLDRMKEAGGAGRPFRFVLSRIFRIYPAVFAVVITFAAIEPFWIFHGLSNRPWLHTLLDMLLVQTDMVLPMWSARVELVATLLILVAWYLRDRFGSVYLVGLGTLLLIASFYRDLYAGDQIGQNLFVFIAGMILVDCREMFRKLPQRLGVSLIMVALAIDIPSRTIFGLSAQCTILVETACCFVTIGIIAHGAVSARWLLSAPARVLGRISYSFYLVHWVLISVMLRCLPSEFVWEASVGNSTLASFEVFAGVAAASAGVAWVLYWAIERPAILLGKKATSACFGLQGIFRSRPKSATEHQPIG